jgi:sugar lactone lactonase YvrE
MKLLKLFLTWLLVFSIISMNAKAANEKSESVYKLKPNDPEALFFTPEAFNIKPDGKMDVSDALQAAINKVKTDKSFGILFIPEGRYRISKTIYVPASIRLIGYGNTRPEIILGKNTPGFQQPDANSQYKESYMLFFTGGLVTEGTQPRDAGAGTFYSAISNIDLRIDDGNPNAVAMRTHYAQHGFVSHVTINIGKGKAGISEVGNEMEDVRFIGGDYGILCGPTSPGWPVAVIDTYFEGQRKAAIQSHKVGLAIVNMHVRNVPVVVEIRENDIDRLYMENCLFDNISEAGVIISRENNTGTQVNMLNIDCRNVPVLAKFRVSGNKIESALKIYKVIEFTHGLVMENMAALPEIKTLSNIEPLQEFPLGLGKDIPVLPAMDTWVNIKELGAKGDGETDDTEVFRDAIAKYSTIYVPQGWYRFTSTLKMRPGTRLIGLHPIATQFILKESEPAFSGFGGPVPLLESSQGGDDILNGIGLSTGGYNYRAVSCKWMAGEKSMMNDVKYVGGHGTMRRTLPQNPDSPRQQDRTGQLAISSPTNPVAIQGKDKAWDNQYWSLWITNNGGGTFKDIWSADSYATSGLFISNTSTPSRIYAMSLEHHVRNEATFKNVSNWKIYAFQLEEESREGVDCQPVDIVNCKDMMFANFWQFRVIRINTPRATGVRFWNCENIVVRNSHDYGQMMFVTETPYYDVNKDLKVFPWEFAKMTVTGQEPYKNKPDHQVGKVERLASEFEFGQGITTDSKGNVYFCETRLSRIYKCSAETGTLSMIADFTWNPFTLATDTKDNLLVVFRYDPQPGYMVNGKQETVVKLADDNPGYSGWGNSGWASYAYSINPDDPEGTITPLNRCKSGDVNNVKKILYPSSRWRNDFASAVVYTPENYFVAPDGVTYIPETYDLGRSAALSEAFPGKQILVADEELKRVVKLNVENNGKLSGLKDFVPQQGEFSQAIDREGNVYIADGVIHIYDSNGNKKGIIEIEERPITIAFGGKEGNILFVTTRNSLYNIRMK